MSQNLCIRFFHLFNLRARRGSYEDHNHFNFNIFDLGRFRPELISKTTDFVCIERYRSFAFRKC